MSLNPALGRQKQASLREFTAALDYRVRRRWWWWWFSRAQILFTSFPPVVKSSTYIKTRMLTFLQSWDKTFQHYRNPYSCPFGYSLPYCQPSLPAPSPPPLICSPFLKCYLESILEMELYSVWLALLLKRQGLVMYLCWPETPCRGKTWLQTRQYLPLSASAVLELRECTLVPSFCDYFFISIILWLLSK